MVCVVFVVLCLLLFVVCRLCWNYVAFSLCEAGHRLRNAREACESSDVIYLSHEATLGPPPPHRHHRRSLVVASLAGWYSRHFKKVKAYHVYDLIIYHCLILIVDSFSTGSLGAGC